MCSRVVLSSSPPLSRLEETGTGMHLPDLHIFPHERILSFGIVVQAVVVLFPCPPYHTHINKHLTLLTTQP